MARVVLDKLTKTYPGKNGADVTAVREVSLAIEDREFMVLVGPSGCGKSTTLRMIAGLEAISSGTISIAGAVVNDVPPKDRDIAMVFQNYALYPHMSVYENLAFGLKMRDFPKVQIDGRVREAARMLELDGLLDRKPRALSGGQRQRVAVGRAIVRRPAVFLFDEPLSNLDAKMRVSTRAEISKLQARLGATTIYVTHDQVEAMTMGDRICVMKDGVVMQVAVPLELYNRPANRFVAGFIGSPPMNFFTGTIHDGGAGLEFVGDAAGAPLTLRLPDSLALVGEKHAGCAVDLGVRPEDLAEVSAAEPGRTVEARVELAEPMGAETHLHLVAGTTAFVARVRPEGCHAPGQTVLLAPNLDKAHLFDSRTGETLR